MRSISRLLSRRVPLYALLLTVLVSGAALAFTFRGKQTTPTSSVAQQTCSASMDQIRTHGKRLVRPLVLADVRDESALFSGTKNELLGAINQMKSQGKASDVSVYFRRLNDGQWFTIDGNKTYNPASLVKVAILVTVLKMAESDPGLLNRRIKLEAHQAGYAQNIHPEPLETGKEYPVRKLLEHMVVYSDNDATVLLQGLMDISLFNTLFSTLGLEVPDFSREYFIGVADFSRIFRLLYNATYLDEKSSEYALDLLTRSTYVDGIVAGIGKEELVAHKFGERVVGGTAQLHEIGIVFRGDDPYLLGVMTSGSDLRELAGVIRVIAEKVHQSTARITAGS